MEGRGRSRRHSPQREWKRRLSSVLAVVLTVVMVLNMPLSIDGLGLRISNAFASGNGTGQDSVWATASNAKYKQGDSKDVDIYVIAEDNGVVPGNTSSMTLYLKNNTDQEITEGVLTFKGKYINKEDVTFQDIGAGEIFDTVIAGGGPGALGQDTAESAEDSAAGAAAFPEASGEGLLYQEVQGTEADGNDAALMDDGNDAALIDDDNDAAPMDDDNDAEPAGDDFDAENGDVEENDEDEEEPWKLEEIDLQPGELHEIHFEFYTEEDIKSTKANVTFSFRGENEEGSRVESSTKFYYSIGLPTVNFSMEDGMQIESGVSNDLEIWMSEPDWVDEDLEEKLLEQEEKKEEEEMKDDEEDAAGGTESGIEPGTATDSEASKDASKASNSNASKNETASDSNADKDNSNTVSQEDEEKIDKYTQEAMEISESRVNYTVEIFGAKVDLHARKTVEAEDIGWISCVYEVDTNTEPGIYYGKVTASGKWNKKDFTSEQGFLFEVTGEAVREYVEETDNVIVRANAEASVLPKDVKLVVKELREDDSDTADQYLEAKEALDTEGTEYEGMMALDISFVNEDGEEIEPDGEVQVSIEMKEGALPEDIDLSTMEVHHMKKVDTDTIKAEIVADSADQADGTVKSAEAAVAELKEAEASQEEIEEAVSNEAVALATFSVESFSSFVIIWEKNEWKNYFEIRVHYVDAASKDEIEGTHANTLSISSGNTINFEDYAGDILGYKYLGAHYGSVSGALVTKVEASSREEGNWISYNVYRLSLDSVPEPTVLEYSEAFWESGDTVSANIYLVYEKQGVEIKDDIINTGQFTAVLSSGLYNPNPENPEEGDTIEYTWYRSKTGADRSWEEVTRQRVTGTADNLSETGESVNVALDSIAAEAGAEDRYWYYVEVEITDASGSATKYKSSSLQVPYYIALQNGSFENPLANNWNEQMPNGREGLVWRTTGEGSGTNNEGESNEGHDIEIVRSTNERFRDEQEWKTYRQKVQEIYSPSGAAEGDQFAELNCEAYGALYQDVMTVPGADLYWYLSHCAREGTDEMALVILPVEKAENLTASLEAISSGTSNNKPQQIRNLLNQYKREGAFVRYCEDGTGKWVKYGDTDDPYTVPSGQYVTRFFFVAVSTGSGNATVGNLLDNVGFQSTPDAPEKDEGRLTVTKVVDGYIPNSEYKVTISVKDENDEAVGSYTLTHFELKEGKYVASHPFTINNMTTYEPQTFTVEETVIGKPNGYEESSTVETEGEGQKQGTTMDVTVTGGDEAEVTFTNTYTKTTGDLEIIKRIVGLEGNEQSLIALVDKLQFSVKKANSNEVVGTYSLKDFIEGEDNTYTFEISDLEPGEYVISEINASVAGYKLTTTGLESHVIVSAGGSAKVNVTNTYTHEDQILTVKKLVDGNMGYIGKTFNFSIRAEESGNYVPLSGDELEAKDNGWYEFELSHNGTVNVSIPYGAEITVKENLSGEEYSTTASAVNAGGEIGSYDPENRSYTISNITVSATLTFTNTKRVNTPTGLFSDNTPYLMMLAIAAIGSTSFIYPACRKKRRKSKS